MYNENMAGLGIKPWTPTPNLISYCCQYPLFIYFPTYFDALLYVCKGVNSHNHKKYHFWAALNKTNKFNPNI